MNTAELLIEILTQELPAIPFLQEFPHIATKWHHSLKAHHIPPCDTQVFFTPRRLVLYAKNFPLYSQDREIEAYGAPISIVYENSGALTKAGLSFFAKHNLDPQLDRDKVSSAIKDGKEVLYFSHTQKGVETTSLLPEIFSEFLQSLHFGKSMRWGSLSEGFIRPIENICAFLGGSSLHLSAFGVDSKPQTFGHRDLGFAPIDVESVEGYFEILRKHKVILNQQERKEHILKQIREIEDTHSVEVELDPALLDEVVAITEYPKALLGRFDEKFLELPKEVIITSMKEHQRYFAIHKQGRLFDGFVVVSNSTNSDASLIISGNQKVLKARLSDAMFFYHNDLKRGLQTQGLENILFVQGLGSLADKSERELQIAQILYAKYAPMHNFMPKNFLELLTQSVRYAKADLLTEMVYEFPELQGIMGGYYAQALGYDELVARAIREQYLPNSEESALPSNALSAIVSLANKLDSIFGLFSIAKIPTGSKDPFALRRAANGVIKIIQNEGFTFNLREDLRALYEALGYGKDSQSGDSRPTTESKALDSGSVCARSGGNEGLALIDDTNLPQANCIKKIESFFLERLENALPVNASIFRAALCGLDTHNQPQRDINALTQNALALHEVFQSTQDKPALLSTFKRVANICKDIDINALDSVDSLDTSLFVHKAESGLFESFMRVKNGEFATQLDRASALFALKSPLEIFFENVLVNDKNERLKRNRYALIGSIYREFLTIGDIAQIAI
ncbi:glycine--tRNA ligase subunit beta [uncultured Helicobacter sp.]|uniref:glycine--tRNA ligase subunit beta n=1 Tax=uncultured Helicobacter sp. TaxID=175537 RepID=UPI00374F5554